MINENCFILCLYFPVLSILIARKNFTKSYDYSLIAFKGDPVYIIQGNKQNEKWLWCDVKGIKAWIPEDYIDKDKSILTMDYDSTELNVRNGEKLEILCTVHQWSWVRNEEKQEGWVPCEIFFP